MIRERQLTLTVMAKWVLIAAVAGISSAAIVASFNVLLNWVLLHTPRLIPAAPYLLPLIGATIIGICLLTWFPGVGGEGVSEYLLAVNRGSGRLNLPVTLLKFPATICTLGFYGSGGIVGPLARIGSGASSFLADRLLRPSRIVAEVDLRIAAICGVSGAFSAIFHAPLAGGFFATEVLRRDGLRYSDLFASILAGGIAVTASRHLLHQQPIFTIDAPAVASGGMTLIWLPLVAVVSGAFGILFVVSFERISTLLRRLTRGQPLTAIAGGVIVCAVWLLAGSWTLGPAMPLYELLAHGDVSPITIPDFIGHHPAILLLLALLAVKILTTSCTIGSGMSAGFTGPLIIIGFGSGALMSAIVGIEPGSASYYVFLACGLPAVLGAALNIPIAAMILTVHMFGFPYLLPAIIGGILAFILFKAKTIYGYYMIDGRLYEADESSGSARNAG